MMFCWGGEKLEKERKLTEEKKDFLNIGNDWIIRQEEKLREKKNRVEINPKKILTMAERSTNQHPFFQGKKHTGGPPEP